MRRSFTLPAFVVNLLNFSYEHVFHEKISDEVKDFLKRLSYVGAGRFIAIPLSFTFNILAGRILGPGEYGKFALVQSVSMFLYIPMLFGFNTAIVKYSSEKESTDRRSRIISTAYILIFFFTIGPVIFYFVFSSQLSNMFSISHGLFYLSLISAVLFVFYTLTTSTLKGLFKMKTFAIFQPVYATIVLLAFLFFIVNDFLSFKSMVYPIFLAYGITSAILLVFFLRKYLRFEFDRYWAKTLTQYSMFAVIGGLSFVFYTNIDRILINRYMTVVDVGIYRVYYMASVNIVGILWNSFNAVFFPTVSKYENKEAVFNRINKLMPFLIGLGIPLVLLCEFVILKLYGSQYPMSFPLMLIFAVVSILVVWYGLYAWTFDSLGIRGVKLDMLSVVTIAILNILLNIYLIPRFGLYGAIMATAVAFTAGICCLHLFKRRII